MTTPVPALPTPVPVDVPATQDEENVIAIDVNELTLRDLIDFEEKTGTSIQDLTGKYRDPITGEWKTRTPGSKQMTALVWIAKRAKDPSYTYEQALDVKFASIKAPKTAVVEADPTQPSS